MILASRRDGGKTRIRDIAREGGLPQKFLQSILLELKKARMLQSVKGAKGGYQMRRDPRELRVSEIIWVVDGTQFDTARLPSDDSIPDHRYRALNQLFIDLRDASARILENTTLADLISEGRDR